MEKHFDLIIIGGGAGAFAAAIKANEYQAKTLMINAGLPLGGTCVNVGCVPSKNLLRVGQLKHDAEHPHFGAIKIPKVEFDFARAIDEEIEIVAELRELKYSNVLANLEHVTLQAGRARFISANEVEVDGARLRGDRFILAIGSTAQPPPIPGIREVGYITHIEALQNKKLPRRLLVIGAGPVALEFAQMFQHFGSQVTLLARGERLYPKTEPEISAALEEYLGADGISIHTNSQVKELRVAPGEKIARVNLAGKDIEIAFDELLIGTGKTPNTAGLGLEKAGVVLSNGGAIKVNAYYQTNAPHIYAVGDAADLPKRLETTAGKEGSFAALNVITGVNKSKLDYALVPSVVFTDPAVADVGLLDEEVPAHGLRCMCGTVYLNKLPKSRVIKDPRGAIKMVAEEKSGRIAGIHILAPHAEELINAAMYIVRARMTIDDVIDSLTVFPTMSEAIKLAALSFRTDIDRISCCI